MGSDGDETSNVVLLEEAGFVKEEILTAIVLPLMMRTNSVFLTISTYGSAFDMWTRITEKCDARGRPVFLVKSYTTVCEDCIEKGIADKCIHKSDMLPRWQGDDEAAKVKALMSDNQQQWLTEAAGIKGTFDFIPSFSKYSVAFLARSIKRVQQHPEEPRMESGRQRLLENLHRRPRLSSMGAAADAEAPTAGGGGADPPQSAVVDDLADSHYEYCFIAIDPSGGGAGSNYSAISAVWERDGVVVVRAPLPLSTFPLFPPPFPPLLAPRPLGVRRGRPGRRSSARCRGGRRRPSGGRCRGSRRAP